MELGGGDFFGTFPPPHDVFYFSFFTNALHTRRFPLSCNTHANTHAKLKFLDENCNKQILKDLTFIFVTLWSYGAECIF